MQQKDASGVEQGCTVLEARSAPAQSVMLTSTVQVEQLHALIVLRVKGWLLEMANRRAIANGVSDDGSFVIY